MLNSNCMESYKANYLKDQGIMNCFDSGGKFMKEI